jgi:chaperonin cofactor prefoldin
MYKSSPSPDTLHRLSQELKKLKPENTVYKLIGPGLMPQDSGEAQQTVEKRLDFIKKEMQVDSPFGS